jgi:N-acetylmuramoyl-L-alanine amidase
MVKIYLDPGHGGEKTGATGNGLQEKDITLKIALYTRESLQSDYNNVSVKMSRTTDTTVSLAERTEEANRWGATVYVSFHINALDGTANGYEDYIFNGLNRDSEDAQLQNAIHQEVSPLFSANRGKKNANFHVLRESNMPAVLTESGFIDHKGDAGFLKEDRNLREIAKAHAKGIAAYLGLSEGTSEPSEPENKVQWVGTDDKGKRVESIYQGSDGLNFYDSPRWNNPSGIFMFGEGWIIDNKYLVDGYPQYRVQNSKGDLYYITASDKYVRVVENSSSSNMTKGDRNTNSIVDYLKSIGEDSSFENRKRLARENGINNYTGTAEQNIRLLRILRG